MLDHFSDELLSAYLDGEVTPAERAEIERQLEDSLDLREQLTVLTEVSQQVRMLKRPYAPPEIRAGVDARIHQLPRPLPPGKGPSVPAGLRRWGNWLTVASAATLLLVAGWALNQHPAENMATTESIPASSVAARKEAAELAQAELSMSMASPKPEQSSLPAQLGEPVQVVNVSRDEIRQRIAELGQKSLAGMSINVPGKLQEGDGQTPIVVVFTVVDVREAMNQMQVLLQQQQVRSPDNQVLALDRDKADQSRLTAVTMELEMDGPEMAAVLNRVAAFDAVMYVDQETNPHRANLVHRANLRDDVDAAASTPTDREKAMAFSKPSGTASPSPDAPARNDVSGKRREVKDEKETLPEQRQFNFEQLVEQSNENALAASAPPRSGVLRKGASPTPSEMKSALQPAERSAVSQTESQSQSAPAELRSPTAPAAASGVPQQDRLLGRIAGSQDGRSAGGAKPLIPAKAPGWEEAKKIKAFILLKQHSPEPLSPGR